MAQGSSFFLSSSWLENYSVTENQIRQAVDPWCKEVLATFLGMPKSLPVFEPSYLKELCCIFWKNFRGKGNQLKGKPIIPSIVLSKVHEKSAARYLSRYADEPRPSIIAFGNYLAPKSKTEPILISLLADIITDRDFFLV